MDLKKLYIIGLILIFQLVDVSIAATPENSASVRKSRALRVGDSWSYSSFYQTLRNYFGYEAEPENQFSKIAPTHGSYGFPVPNSIHLNPVPPVHVMGTSHWTRRNAYPKVNQTCGKIFLGQCQRSPYRSYDGSCNNLVNPTWGMAQTPYSRLLPAIYSDGIWQPALSRSGRPLPRSRVLSYTLFPEVRIKDPRWTLATMQYGQIITHDMAELITPPMTGSRNVPCCTNNGQLAVQNLNDPSCFPIVVGPNDPVYPMTTQCLAFRRTVTDQSLGCPSENRFAEQMTRVTQFLDLSLVYGSAETMALGLRTGIKGKMLADIRNGKEWLPHHPNASTVCNIDSPNDVCYLAGDDRVNQNTQLTVIQIILLREHNRIAERLSALNPHWSDETIFQETRRILIAIHQHISYVEWLPIITGPENALKYKLIYNTDDYVDDYDQNVNPTVLNEHSNAANRVFHSLVAGYLKLVQENRSPSQTLLRLSDWFQRPSVIEQANNMDALTRGLADQPEQARDPFYDHEITVFLFRMRNRLGNDLRATDIHRARDHGLASYNDFREFCGLRRARTWADFSDFISAKSIEKLSQLYETPDDVDLAVGGSLENNVDGALTGPTFLCILIEQFHRTRVGDRFWYESSNPDTGFTREQLREIRKASIGRLFCDNSDNVRNMQLRAFEIPSPSNPIMRCEDLPAIDLNHWKDFAPDVTGHAHINHAQNIGIFYKKK